MGNTWWSDFLELINPEFKRPISTFPPSSSAKFFISMVFSDGRLLALEASYEDDKVTVTLRDMLTGKSIASLPRWGRGEDWASSPDGSLLALASDGAIDLWEVSSKEHVATIDAPHEEDENLPTDYDDYDYVVASLAFSPDGRLLASGGRNDYLVKLWALPSGEHVATIDGHRTLGGSITSLAFSPDGKRLATYDAGGTVRLWEVSSREHVATIDAHENGSWSDGKEVVFSPDGRLLATGGTRWTSFVEETSEVRLWNVSTGEPISAPLFGSAPFPPAASGWQR